MASHTLWLFKQFSQKIKGSQGMPCLSQIFFANPPCKASDIETGMYQGQPVQPYFEVLGSICNTDYNYTFNSD